MAIGDYTKTTYVNDGPPSISAANLNNIENKVSELDTWAETPATDTISERTAAAGVTVDGVLLKDSTVNVDTISEKTSAAGVTIDGLLIKDGAIPSISPAVAPVGSMTMYAGASVPTGWLLCDGQAVSRTTYSALFTAISTTWGVGNGSTTFNVPDMREASPYGAGTYSAVTGTTHGSITAHDAKALGTFADDQLQGHFHDANLNTGGGASTALTGITNASAITATPYALNAIKGPVTDGTNGTPRAGSTTRGKIIGINFIIKY